MGDQEMAQAWTKGDELMPLTWKPEQTLVELAAVSGMRWEPSRSGHRAIGHKDFPCSEPQAEGRIDAREDECD
jgi:hypothetical protein